MYFNLYLIFKIKFKIKITYVKEKKENRNIVTAFLSMKFETYLAILNTKITAVNHLERFSYEDGLKQVQRLFSQECEAYVRRSKASERKPCYIHAEEMREMDVVTWDSERRYKEIKRSKKEWKQPALKVIYRILFKRLISPISVLN